MRTIGRIALLASLIAAAASAACADATAPRNLIEPCDSDGSNAETCGPRPRPPRDSALVCMVSYDAATNTWSEWCGWIPVVRAPASRADLEAPRAVSRR